MNKRTQAIINTAEQMVLNDRQRNLAFEVYDDMYHNDWSLPPELKELDWIREVVSSMPHDAIEAATRVLAGTEPSITYTPLTDKQEEKDAANDMERALLWELKSANRRRPNPVEADVAHSAVRYAAVAALVVDLDWQLKQASQIAGSNTKKLKMMRRYGRFLIRTPNPKDVHVQYSGNMPERVLLRQTRPAQEVRDEWGDNSRNLKNLADEGKDVQYNDYWDLDRRVVWWTSKGGTGSEVDVLFDEENPLEFWPWVAMMGGSTLEDAVEDKYHPLLYGPRSSGAWENLNVALTLNFSEVIAHTAAPPYVEEGPNDDTTEIDYGTPGGIAKPPVGNKLTPLQKPQLDPGTMQWGDRFASQIEHSTISKVLYGDIPSGAAFATLNLATQTAIGALKPAKRLAEQALAEVFTIMLLWIKHGGDKQVAYGMDKRDNLGKQLTIDPQYIYDQIYIDVELKPDEPTDRMQRAQTAMMLKQIGYPNEWALEDMGVTDPQKAMEMSFMEQWFQALFQNEIAQMQAQTQLQAQTEAQQAQQAQQLQAQTLAEGMAQVTGGGQGFNPAQGGLPPAMMNPNMTREMVTGADRMGNEVMR